MLNALPTKQTAREKKVAWERDGEGEEIHGVETEGFSPLLFVGESEIGSASFLPPPPFPLLFLPLTLPRRRRKRNPVATSSSHAPFPRCGHFERRARVERK